jgi:hypothetical protein
MVAFSFIVTNVSAQEHTAGPRVEVSQPKENIYKLACTDQFVSNCVALVGDE